MDSQGELTALTAIWTGKWKIGFHTGPTGDPSGVGIFMNALDVAGIPFYIKGTDHAGIVFEGQEIAKKSSTPHVLSYRKSGIGTFDTPNYYLPPDVAAKNHFVLHRDVWPKELDKRMVWWETVNEVDKGRSEWMAEFCEHFAMLALDAGFKWASPGWSGGEPEIEHWMGEESLDFLDLVCSMPDRLAIALHEYSYDTTSLASGVPHQIGRFKQLFDVCDLHIGKRPTVLISEFGWSYNDIPDTDTAMAQLEPVARMYAEHHEILGAALWDVGGNKELARKVNKLFVPIANKTINQVFEAPTPLPVPVDVDI